MKLSKNLPDEQRYIKIKKHTKRPIGFKWNDSENLLNKKQATEWLKVNESVGFCLGNGYVCIDCDRLELQQVAEDSIKTKTYTQISGKRELNQYIFKCLGFEENLDLKYKGESVGQILCKGKQVILAPSKYKITAQDVKKEPELNLILGEKKQYKTLNDIPIAEIPIEEIMKVVLAFENKFVDKAESTLKTYKPENNSEIDNLNILSVISTTGMEKDNQGRYFGSNPYHSSTTGHNFWITPSKNLAYCFRCDTAISPAKAIALNEGIINNCSDRLKGEDFIKVIEIAKQKYGLNTNQLNDIQTNNSFSKKEQEKPELHFWNFKDYENYREPKNYIIEGLDYESEIGMNYGQTGSLKSINMLYKAICISSGKKYLGKFRTKKKAVCILSAENSISTDKERLFAIRRGLNIRKKDTELYILPRHECQDLLHFGFKGSLFDFLKEKNIKVLFLDTINPLTPELDDISTRDVTKLFNEFLKPCSEMGVRVEFLHHTDKQGKQFLGSMKFKANCDSVTRIERDDLSNTFKLYNEKNRRGETNTLDIQIEFIKDSNNKLKKINVILVDDSGKPEIYVKRKKPSKTARFKTELLKSIPENLDISRSEIMQIYSKDIEAGKISMPTIDRYLKELVQLEKLQSVEKGVYRK